MGRLPSIEKHSCFQLTLHLPVGHMVNKMLLKHEAPFLNDVEQGLSEWTRVDSEPLLKDDADFHRLHVSIYYLISVDLSNYMTGNELRHRIIENYCSKTDL